MGKGKGKGKIVLKGSAVEGVAVKVEKGLVTAAGSEAVGVDEDGGDDDVVEEGGGSEPGFAEGNTPSQRQFHNLSALITHFLNTRNEFTGVGENVVTTSNIPTHHY